MKKTITTLALAAAASISSHATPFIWQDLDVPNVILTTAAPTTSGVLNVHQYDNDGSAGTFGFYPNIDIITSAVVGFTFAITDTTELQQVNVTFDVSTLNGSGSSIVGQNVFSLGNGINGSILAELNTDGFLTYTITKTGPQSVILTGANLTAVGEKIPEAGSTLMLLGSAVVGLGTISRRKKA